MALAWERAQISLEISLENVRKASAEQPWQLPGQPSDSGHAGTHGPCAAAASSCLTANMSHVTSLHGTHMELHKILVSN